MYKGKSLEDNKERALHRNMLLPLSIKFIPEEESDHDSEEEPELEQCHIERQISEKISQPIVSIDMTPLGQSNLEYGQENTSSDLEHVDTPVGHVNPKDIQQGSMAPPTAISSDQFIDPHMSLDPKFLVPIEDSVDSDTSKSTHLSSKYNDTSLILPSTEDNSDSLIKTEEFLEFVDEISQEPSPLSDRENLRKFIDIGFECRHFHGDFTISHVGHYPDLVSIAAHIIVNGLDQSVLEEDIVYDFPQYEPDVYKYLPLIPKAHSTPYDRMQELVHAIEGLDLDLLQHIVGKAIVKHGL